MAAKRFHVEKPDQLGELEAYAIEQPNSILRIRNIWATARQKKAANRWDSAFYVCFSGDRKREAGLYRISADGNIVNVCTLRYNLAHRYCQDHLRQVYD